MKLLKNMGVALVFLSSALVHADAASIITQTAQLAKDTAATNIKNIQKYASKTKTDHSRADIEKYYAALNKRINQLKGTNTTTAQQIEMILLQVAGANSLAIDQRYLEMPSGIKNDALALSKQTETDATALRKAAGYKSTFKPALMAKIAELGKNPSTANKIQILLLQDYYS